MRTEKYSWNVVMAGLVIFLLNEVCLTIFICTELQFKFMFLKIFSRL